MKKEVAFDSPVEQNIVFSFSLDRMCGASKLLYKGHAEISFRCVKPTGEKNGNA